jgi:ribonuclease D
MRRNDEARMTNDERSPNARMTKERAKRSHRHLDFVIPLSLDIRHSSLPGSLITSAAQLHELLPEIESVDRAAVDTEADSLHCYREKLCLLQISLTARDYIVDPLANVDLAPLSAALERKEIVLHGADFDLRLLRRGLNFAARRIFDTVIAARMLGIRDFSLAALVKRHFDVDLGKGSQKANWARRPLSDRMLEYAMNDTHYLLPLADRLESQLREHDRLDWLRQSCQRAIEQAAVERVRDEDELWRIRGSAPLSGRAAAVLRALWQWREKEAEAADRPPFHILQNDELLNAAVSFAAESVPDYRYFSSRRRQTFRRAAQGALQLPEAEWPVSRRRFGTRPSTETVRRTEQLRQRRDRAARELDLESAFIASRSTLEAIAADQTRAAKLLAPWQRELLGVSGEKARAS